MPQVFYRNDNREAARLAARLKGDCPSYSPKPQTHMAANAEYEGNPTRCITTVYFGGTEANHGGNPNPVYKGNQDY